MDEAGGAIDVEWASASIDVLTDKRSWQRSEANASEMAWKESVRKHNVRLRREHQGEWFCYWSALADSLRASAEHFERKTQALLEDEP